MVRTMSFSSRGEATLVPSGIVAVRRLSQNRDQWAAAGRLVANASTAYPARSRLLQPAREERSCASVSQDARPLGFWRRGRGAPRPERMYPPSRRPHTARESSGPGAGRPRRTARTVERPRSDPLTLFRGLGDGPLHLACQALIEADAGREAEVAVAAAGPSRFCERHRARPAGARPRSACRAAPPSSQGIEQAHLSASTDVVDGARAHQCARRRSCPSTTSSTKVKSRTWAVAEHSHRLAGQSARRNLVNAMSGRWRGP